MKRAAGRRARAQLATNPSALERFNAFLLRLEAWVGSPGTAALAGLALLLVAALCARPAIYPTHLGVQYVLLSLDPFDTQFPNKVGFRILTPLISYLLGLRGRTLLITNVLIAWGFLTLVYGYFRRAWGKPALAFLAGGTLAISLVTLTTLYFGGYCDSLTYALIFLMWAFRRNPILAYGCFFLGLWNRESMVFVLPWILCVQWLERPDRGRLLLESALGIGICLALYIPGRNWLAARHPIEYSAAYYLHAMRGDLLYWVKMAFPYQVVGLVSVFKLLWIIPVLAFFTSLRRGDGRTAWGMIVLLAATTLQFLVAYDSSRLYTQLFMVMVVGLLELHRNRPGWLENWGPGLLLINALVPQPFTAAREITYLTPLPLKIVQVVFYGARHW